MNKFLEAFQSQDLVGLILNLVAIWGALALSIVLLAKLGSGFGAENNGPRDAPWTPPGELIGAVWACLYTLMAVSLWVLNFGASEYQFFNKLSVIVLIIFCLMWPFYAFDTPSRWPGLLGNIGILLLAIFAVWRLWPHSHAAALMIMPVAIWITIASATIIDGARRYGW